MSWCPGQMPDRGRVGPAFCRDRCWPRHPSRVLCACLRAMLPDGTPPLGGGYRPQKHEGLAGCTHIITAHSGTIWCDAGAYGVGMRLALILPGEGSSRLLTGCTPHLPRSYAASRSLPWQRHEGAVRGVQGDYQIPRCLFRKSVTSKTSCPRRRASSSHGAHSLDSRFRGNDGRP